MALKVVNMFGELALESTLRKILSAITFAKTPSDQLRVITDSGSATTSTVYAAGTSANIGVTNLVPFGALSWNAHDIREQYMYESQLNFMQARNRWTIT